MLLRGTVDSATLTPTTTLFEASSLLDASGTNHAGDASGKLTDQFVKFTTGTLAGHSRRILSHTLVGGKARFQVETMQGAPSAGDRFIVL
jgi:hypothetical protein